MLPPRPRSEDWPAIVAWLEQIGALWLERLNQLPDEDFDAKREWEGNDNYPLRTTYQRCWNTIFNMRRRLSTCDSDCRRNVLYNTGRTCASGLVSGYSRRFRPICLCLDAPTGLQVTP